MLVGVEESSRLLSIHHATVRRWIAQGKLPAVRLGRRVLIRREALQELIERAGSYSTPRGEPAAEAGEGIR